MNLDPRSKSFAFFTRMVDELVEFGEQDEELAEGIRWLDKKAQQEGISFYEIIFRTLYKHDLITRAKTWRTKDIEGSS